MVEDVAIALLLCESRRQRLLQSRVKRRLGLAAHRQQVLEGESLSQHARRVQRLLSRLTETGNAIRNDLAYALRYFDTSQLPALPLAVAPINISTLDQRPQD